MFIVTTLPYLLLCRDRCIDGSLENISSSLVQMRLRFHLSPVGISFRFYLKIRHKLSLNTVAMASNGKEKTAVYSQNHVW